MRRADVAAAYDSRAEEYVELLGSVEQMAAHDRATICSWALATPGDLAALPLDSGSVDGVLAWFLVPGGSLLLGFVVGEPGQPFDHAVTTAYRWTAPALAEVLAPHGFVVERWDTRQDPGAKRPQGDLVARLTA